MNLKSTSHTVHELANSRTLGFFRVFLFGLWIPFLAFDPIQNLSFLEPIQLHPPGVLSVIPSPAWDAIIAKASLLTFKYSLLTLLVLTTIGIGNFRLVAIPTVILLIFYQGLYRSFGGHVNHQELALLGSNIILCFFPCYDSLTVVKHKGQKKDNSIYFSAVYSVLLFVTFTYAIIGVARVIQYQLEPYTNDSMLLWVIAHGLKDNYWHFDLSSSILKYPLLEAFFQFGLAFATILEITSPVALVNKYYRLFWIPSIIGFHLMIFATMNIFFIQNILIVLLFFDFFKKNSSEQESFQGVT